MFSPIPIYKTPFFLRIFGYKKLRYRERGRWVYANNIHEIANYLKDYNDDLFI
jgi:hypothetical protein